MNGRLKHLQRIKILEDLIVILKFLRRVVLSYVKSFALATLLMAIVFAARAAMGSYALPQAIANIVNAVRNGGATDSKLYTGLSIFLASAITFFTTEFLLYKYFSKLSDAIVSIKNVILERLKVKQLSDSLEDVVGKITSDVDFVIWNINGVLTTLIPNIFNAVASIVAVYSFNVGVGHIVLLTVVPYFILAEYYSRRVEFARVEERKAYSASIVHIRNAVYEHKDFDLLSNILSQWKRAINAVMWYDRIYWGFSLLNQFTAATLIAAVSIGKARQGEIDVGSLAGILSASLGAHGAVMNAVWALCIQGQTVAAVKRVLALFERGVTEHKEREVPATAKIR